MKAGIKIFGRENDYVLEFESSNEELLRSIFGKLISIFDLTIDQKSMMVNVSIVQKYSNQIENRLEEVVNEISAIDKKINKLKHGLNKLKYGEYFFVFPSDYKMDTKLALYWGNLLHSLNEGEDLSKILQTQNNLFECVLGNYEILGFHDKGTKVGEEDKKLRVCRFCGKKYPEVTFRHKSHAISEGLGNKNLIANEECDDCNQRLGREVENDLINYLGFHRTFFQILAKGGVKKVRAKGFKFESVGKKMLKITYQSAKDKEEGPPTEIPVEMDEEIIMQGIYKALCKFAISVVDAKYLPWFKKTVDWINGKVEVDALPRVGAMLNYGIYSQSPQITLYMRSTKNFDLPSAVGEFRFAAIVYVFIIPFSTEDEKNFVRQDDFQVFWDCFKQYSSHAKWIFNDFSDRKKRKLAFNVKFVGPRSKSEDVLK